MIKFPNEIKSINESEQIRIEQKDNDGEAYLECRVWARFQYSWLPTEHAVKIDMNDLVRLSDAVDVLRDQSNKTALVNVEWDRRLNETSTVFDQKYKNIKHNIVVACSELSAN